MFTQEEESSRNLHHSRKNLYVLNILHWFNLFQFMRSRLRPVYEATELVAPKPKWIKNGLPDILDCPVNNTSSQRDRERPWM